MKVPSLDGLVTERLRLRRLTLEDVTPWLEFFASADALRCLGHEVGDRAGCELMIEKQLARYAVHGGGLHAVLDRSTRAMLGMAGLLTQDVHGRVELEVGYHFLPRVWGNGYATEAAIACREFGFRHTAVPHIVSLIHPDNGPSQRVAERNGLRRTDETMEWNGLPIEVWQIRRDER